MDDLYTEAQIAGVLNDCGVELEGQTYSDFLGLCPFHGNRRTPALSVSRHDGRFICFSPECGESGTLIDLVSKLKKKNHFQAIRHIRRFAGEEEVRFANEIEGILERPRGFIEFDQAKIDRAQERFWESSKAQDYMYGRGFTDEALKHFSVGYVKHPKADFWYIVVPMHDKAGMPVGWIGRSIEGKFFKNSRDLPTGSTLFNIHRVKRFNEIIIVESSFDVMTLWQYGYHNAVASLGGHMSPHKIEQLKRFDSIVIMTDDDEWAAPKGVRCNSCKTSVEDCILHSKGLELGLKIQDSLPMKDIWWPIWNDLERFPAKDVGEMTKTEIDICMANRESEFKFNRGERYRPQNDFVVQ